MNIDRANHEWIESYKLFAMATLGKLDSEASVICSMDWIEENPITGQGYEYVLDGKIMLPTDAGKICLVMAMFSQAWLAEPASIKGMDELAQYPDKTFNLRSLLTAAYPRHVVTEKFKGDNVGIYIPSAFHEKAEENIFMAFGGLGVILMEKLRLMLGEGMTDEEVVEKCTNRYIIFEDQQ